MRGLNCIVLMLSLRSILKIDYFCSLGRWSIKTWIAMETKMSVGCNIISVSFKKLIKNQWRVQPINTATSRLTDGSRAFLWSYILYKYIQNTIGRRLNIWNLGYNWANRSFLIFWGFMELLLVESHKVQWVGLWLYNFLLKIIIPISMKHPYYKAKLLPSYRTK